MSGLVTGFGWILARMDTIRAGLTKPIEQYPLDVNPRLEFDQLHKLSTNVLTANLFLGLTWFVVSVVKAVIMHPCLCERASVGSPYSIVLFPPKIST